MNKRSLRALLFAKESFRHQDWPLAKLFMADLFKMLRQRQVNITPLVLIRTWIVVSSAVDAWHIDQADLETQDPKHHALPEALGKAHERLRKAMKDLEDCCTKQGRPPVLGLADRMKPILLKTRGILEEALAAGPDPGDELLSDDTDEQSA